MSASMPGKHQYVCKIATPEEMNQKWDYEIRQHPGEKTGLSGRAKQSLSHIV